MVVEATTQLGEHFSVRQWGGDDAALGVTIPVTLGRCAKLLLRQDK